MKKVIFFILFALTFISCKTKKTDEVNNSTDSITYDLDSIMQADMPASSLLASSLLSGYSVKNTAQTDSINFVLYLNQEELNKNFIAEKNEGKEIVNPDFIINYVIGIICLPSQFTTSISIDKVEVMEQEISVYVNIKKEEKQKIATRAAQLFQIEKRNDIATMQFFVNGEKDKSFFLTGL